MTFKEKINKLLATNKLGIGSVNALEKRCGTSSGAIAKPLRANDEPGVEIIKKIKEKLGVNERWWDTGEGPIYLTEVKSPAQQFEDKAVSVTQVPESIYKDLVEANSEYRLVPRTILQEEYRIMLLSEIEDQKVLRDKALESKDKMISMLQDRIAELNDQISKLRGVTS